MLFLTSYRQDFGTLTGLADLDLSVIILSASEGDREAKVNKLSEGFLLGVELNNQMC